MSEPAGQLSVSVGVRDTPVPRKSSRNWRLAVRLLHEELEKRQISPEQVIKLEVPPHIEEGWHVSYKGRTYRCVVSYVPYPLGDLQPGMYGRVDIAWR